MDPDDTAVDTHVRIYSLSLTRGHGFPHEQCVERRMSFG